MKERFLEIYNTYVKREGANELLEWLKTTDFFEAPASTRFHGSYEGGLVEHSVNVFDEMVRLLKAYPGIKVSGETAAIISLMHDVCKCGCYKVSMRNKKDENGKWVQVPYYEFS